MKLGKVYQKAPFIVSSVHSFNLYNDLVRNLGRMI